MQPQHNRHNLQPIQEHDEPNATWQSKPIANHRPPTTRQELLTINPQSLNDVQINELGMERCKYLILITIFSYHEFTTICSYESIVSELYVTATTDAEVDGDVASAGMGACAGENEDGGTYDESAV